jgi:hypothetical protein
MDRILIGSNAIKHWFSDFKREPKDFDYIVDENQGGRMGITELLPNPVLFQLYKGTGKTIVEPDHLCTLKASHLCWDLAWDKHMYDLQYLLNKGCTIDRELFFKLYEYWNKYHGKNRRSDLTLTKEDFFDNAINYDENEHDEIHLILNPIPVYTKVLGDNKEVELDENKYMALSYEDKIKFVQEEVMVMSWERYRHKGWKPAFMRMLKKFIMNHCPLFALPFTLTHYDEISKIKYNYIKQINDELETIKRSAGQLQHTSL